MSRAADPPLLLTPAESIWRSTARLTSTGRALLADERDWLACGPHPCWVGGVEINAGAKCWRFDSKASAVVFI